MKISALIPNLATNCIVRGWPILKVLERTHEVEVIGSLRAGEALFPPYAKEFDYKIVHRGQSGWSVLSTLRALEARITGDVVYAFKPLTLSYGAALLDTFRRRRPVILDIEDWETWGLYREPRVAPRAPPRQASRRTRVGGPPLAQVPIPHGAQATSLASARTVVSTFLAAALRGTLLRHGADSSVFVPERFDRRELRDKWGIKHDRPADPVQRHAEPVQGHR